MLFAPAALKPSLAADDPAEGHTESRRLHSLFRREWEATLHRHPGLGTRVGDARFNDRLPDESREAIAAHDAIERDCLSRARTIRRSLLTPEDQLSLDLFIDRMQHRVDAQAHPGLQSLVLGLQGGAQSELADLLRIVPMDTALQAREAIARMESYPRLANQRIGQLRRGAALGWIAPRSVLERVLAQIDSQLPDESGASPFFTPFLRIAADVPQDERRLLREAARECIGNHVAPALRRLRDCIVRELVPAAHGTGALCSCPGGKRAYETLVRRRTTTQLSPAEIHAMGMTELERLQDEIRRTMRDERFRGTLAEFSARLYADPRTFHASPEAMLADYRAIAARLDAQLPRLFAQLPCAPYEVRAMPSFRGANASESYEPPSTCASRPGIFHANLLAWRTRPRWAMATITAHESVPGHHIQAARAIELQGLPDFRRHAAPTAFCEGWAVYAETLARECGVFDCNLALFGHLQYQALRAARLVVDTGLHAMEWTREQAITFMRQHTGMEEAFIAQEVDRYLAWPGEALGYMVGMLTIRDLREKATRRLGARFDLRRFHDAVLGNGALPLGMLGKVIEDWSAAQS